MGVARWIRQRSGGSPASVASEGLRITRSRTAWAVAILFGLQSTQAYVTIGWVPQIYRDAGLSPTYAGVLLALILVIGVPTSFLVPTIAARRRNQGGVAVALTALGFVGYLGLLLIPATLPWLWVIVLGTSQAVFPLALSLIGLRTRSAAGTVGLSSFGQSVGYLISIPGPIVVGSAVRGDRWLDRAPDAAHAAAGASSRGRGVSPGATGTWRTTSDRDRSGCHRPAGVERCVDTARERPETTSSHLWTRRGGRRWRSTWLRMPGC